MDEFTQSVDIRFFVMQYILVPNMPGLVVISYVISYGGASSPMNEPSNGGEPWTRDIKLNLLLGSELEEKITAPENTYFLLTQLRVIWGLSHETNCYCSCYIKT